MTKELLPQFLSSLIIICSVIVVSQLVRMSEVLMAFGLSVENVFLPFLYVILPFISLTIPMAYLFAVVLTFARLSADGEYAALLAAGFSLRRMLVPVMLVAALLYGVASTCAMYLEAWGRREFVQFLYRKSQTELDNMVRYQMQAGVFQDNFLGYVLYAEKISEDRTRFENVLLAPGRSGSRENDEVFILMAPSGSITGSVEAGTLRLALDHGLAYSSIENSDSVSTLRFHHAEVDILRIFHEQILGADAADDDFRSYPPGKLMEFVGSLKYNLARNERKYLRARYLLHQRVAAPFSVIPFALFGMVFGISDPRKGRSQAYIGALGTIICGYILLMSFKWVAEQGYLAAPLAAWIPNIFLTAIGGFLVYQKNRLPPSEGTLDLDNLPITGRLRRARRAHLLKK